MSDFNLLIFLVQKKNELNRRRRRFYYHWAGRTGLNKTTGKWERRNMSHLSQEEAMVGYEKAKRDMKAMTPVMRKMRKELNVRFEWNDSGMIVAVHRDADSPKMSYRGIKYTEFQYYIEKLKNEHEVNKILLGDTDT